jgi:hypothetical protein
MFKKLQKSREERIKKQLVVKKVLGLKSLSRRKTSVADPDPRPS